MHLAACLWISLWELANLDIAFILGGSEPCLRWMGGDVHLAGLGGPTLVSASYHLGQLAWKITMDAMNILQERCHGHHSDFAMENGQRNPLAHGTGPMGQGPWGRPT